jgi:outer membrane protein OmpA-like peptidoglycan-associated protein
MGKNIKTAMIFVMCLISFFLLFSSIALSKDIKGCKDHPLISRYVGSEFVNCRIDKFNEYRLLIKKAMNSGGKGKNIDSTMNLEGKVSKITYKIPSERSTLEVFRNYESALKKADFKILYSCSNEGCGGRNFNHAVVPYTSEFAENYENQRYLAAHLKRDEGDVYVSFYIVRNTSSGGPTYNLIFTQLDVIEAQPMDAGLVIIDSNTMEKEISKTGRVALYGIYFDTNKADVKPESMTTLKEIAKLLKKKNGLELAVVGHTDNKGSFEYNMDLSKHRAKAVVDVLVKDYGIIRSRLTHWGVGFLSPVASNKSDAGRAKNRRVELVER